MPKWSATRPAAAVLSVLPMPMANPTAPSDRLKCPDRAATSLTISGTKMPKPAAAMPSSTCTPTAEPNWRSSRTPARAAAACKADDQHQPAPVAIGEPANRRRGERHDDLRQHDAGADQQARIAALRCEGTADQHQKRRIRESEQHRAAAEDEQPPIGQNLEHPRLAGSSALRTARRCAPSRSAAEAIASGAQAA